jgi:hypothetical protein
VHRIQPGAERASTRPGRSRGSWRVTRATACVARGLIEPRRPCGRPCLAGGVRFLQTRAYSCVWLRSAAQALSHAANTALPGELDQRQRLSKASGCPRHQIVECGHDWSIPPGGVGHRCTTSTARCCPAELRPGVLPPPGPFRLSGRGGRRPRANRCRFSPLGRSRTRRLAGGLVQTLLPASMGCTRSAAQVLGDGPGQSQLGGGAIVVPSRP